MREDQYDSDQYHESWYKMDLTNITDIFQPLFLQLYEDKETKDFISQSRDKSDQLMSQLLHVFLKFFLTFFMANTSANGLLSRGSMFVFSSSQFKMLLDLDESNPLDNILDLGAGDGSVTQRFAQYYKNVYCTEKSSTMVWRLGQRGFKTLEADDWHSSGHMFDTITCLNLLDRCDNPLDLLKLMHTRLKPGSGRLVVALVLPLNPYVEFGESNDKKPKQRLEVKGKSFEEQVDSAMKDVFQPAGYELVKFSKVPYLCEGDMQHSYYLLHDAVFVLKPNQTFIIP